MTVRSRPGRGRRPWCWGLALVLLALAAGGCGGKRESLRAKPVGRSETRESPRLAEQVRAGQLPPLEQRLPEHPVVVRPFGEAAEYGGALRVIMSGYWSYGGIDNVHSCRLIRAEPERGGDGKMVLDNAGKLRYRLVGNLVESWRQSADGRVVEMTLRKGLRYSDGQPLTVEDLVYRWEIWNDTERYGEVSPVPVQRLRGKPVRLEAVDEYRFRFVLPAPDFGWVQRQAINLQFWEAPKHWMRQWDPNLNPQAKSWDEFKRRLGDWFDTSRPVLGPWRVVKWDSATKLVAERNPYFYMVDTEGRQLPYIDRVEGIAVANADIAAMKVVAGQVDLYDDGRLEDLPLLKKNEARGDYRLELLGEGPGTFPGYMINFFTSRDRLAEYLRKREFRVALSLGIDREEVNQLVFYGFGVPTNASYGGWYKDVNAGCDPAQAQALLDHLGLRDRDGDGVREYPEGKKVTIVVTCLGTYASATELVVGQWRALGLEAILNNVDDSQYGQMRSERRYDVLSAHDGSYRYTPDTNVEDWSPLSRPIDLSKPEGTSDWEPYLRWYKSGGRQGQRPPPDMEAGLREVARLYEEEYAPARDAQTAERAARGIARLWAENAWRLGVVGRAPSPLVLGNGLRNVPEHIEEPPGGYWLRAGVYAYQLCLAQ